MKQLLLKLFIKFLKNTFPKTMGMLVLYPKSSFLLTTIKEKTQKQFACFVFL